MPEGKILEFGLDELRGEIMDLTQQQIEAFDNDGYLFFLNGSLLKR
jgi:hypothetical protein